MTSQEAWVAFRAWLVTQVPGITVIQAHQNAPAPAKPYIAISRLSIQPTSMEQRKWTGSVTLSETVRNNYTATCQVYAVTDPGQEYPADLLRRAFSMRGHSSQVSAMSKAGFSIRNVRGPNDTPMLDALSYVQEASCTVTLAFAHEESAAVGRISTVEVTQDLP